MPCKAWRTHGKVEQEDEGGLRLVEGRGRRTAVQRASGQSAKRIKQAGGLGGGTTDDGTVVARTEA